MIIKTKDVYQCEVCKSIYDDPGTARMCESRGISEDKGIKVGDIVLVTGGDGTGKKAKVTRVYVISKDWGHYAWEKYWHTIALNADLIDDWGSRMLTFDNYEVIR